MAAASARAVLDEAVVRARDARERATNLARDVSTARRALDEARQAREAATKGTDTAASAAAVEAEETAQAAAYEAAKIASLADTAAGAAANRVDEATFRMEEAEAAWHACADQRDGVTQPVGAGSGRD